MDRVYSGGGGAGGLLELTNPYLSAMTHYVTVGSGGVAIPADYANVGNDGMNGEVSRLQVIITAPAVEVAVQAHLTLREHLLVVQRRK